MIAETAAAGNPGRARRRLIPQGPSLPGNAPQFANRPYAKQNRPARLWSPNGAGRMYASPT